MQAGGRHLTRSPPIVPTGCWCHCPPLHLLCLGALARRQGRRPWGRAMLSRAHVTEAVLRESISAGGAESTSGPDLACKPAGGANVKCALVMIAPRGLQCTSASKSVSLVARIPFLGQQYAPQQALSIQACQHARTQCCSANSTLPDPWNPHARRLRYAHSSGPGRRKKSRMREQKSRRADDASSAVQRSLP